MKYSVDFNKKEIAYQKLPPGHLIALKKMYEPKGYSFKEVNEIYYMEQFDETIDYENQHQERAFKMHTSPGGRKLFDEAIKKEFEKQSQYFKQNGIMPVSSKKNKSRAANFIQSNPWYADNNNK